MTLNEFKLWAWKFILKHLRKQCLSYYQLCTGSQQRRTFHHNEQELVSTILQAQQISSSSCWYCHFWSPKYCCQQCLQYDGTNLLFISTYAALTTTAFSCSTYIQISSSIYKCPWRAAILKKEALGIDAIQAKVLAEKLSPATWSGS